MTTKGNKSNKMRLEQVARGNSAELYAAPHVEVIDIELTQNILQNSPAPAQQDFGLPDYTDGGSAW
ncbi:MAG TPA: hypothetical protein GXZ56_07220 [Bacteroidales bacterium]|jgi:hypothetical protein|nr:hypothetical protein [Bacteroidales bacterium]